jgi:hypothetical protein
MRECCKTPRAIPFKETEHEADTMWSCYCPTCGRGMSWHFDITSRESALKKWNEELNK